MKQLLFILSILFFVSCGTTCSNEQESTPTVKVERRVPLNAKYLGKVGSGHRGDFNVFSFEVDGIEYIVASEYNGGMALIDKKRK